MKLNSKQVKHYILEKMSNGVYHLMFTTRDRFVHFHQLNNETYEIGEPVDGEKYEEYLQEIPEGLIPKNQNLICTSIQEKDQISFFFIPMDMLFPDTPVEVLINTQK